MRVFLLFFGLLICACNGISKSEGRANNDTSGIAYNSGEQAERPYSSFNEFLNSILCNSVSFTPATINDSIIKRAGGDTTIHYFDFSGIKFKYGSVLQKQESDDPCDSLFSYYFAANDRMVQAKSIPDSLRNADFNSGTLCGLTLQLAKAGKIELNGVTYLIIPSSTSECIGAFCHTELDHLFEIKDNKLTYLTVDGWQICDVNNDNQIEQIVFNDDPIRQYRFLDKLRKKRPNDTTHVPIQNCANIQIWTFKNNEWTPLLDANNNPYFIFLEFDAISQRDTYRILDCNWTKKI